MIFKTKPVIHETHLFNLKTKLVIFKTNPVIFRNKFSHGEDKFSPKLGPIQSFL